MSDDPHSLPSDPVALPSDPVERLRAIMTRLRDPVDGCPWDIEQTFATIAPHTIEEAYEVAEAVSLGDMDHLCDELGDLLLQVVYHAEMAREDGHFDFDDVAAAIAEKLVRRHPHVFGGADIATAEAQTAAWEAQKADERAHKARQSGRRASALDGVTVGLPALTRALKLQKRAARVGFDWPDVAGVLDKIAEETAELRAEMAADPPDQGRIAEEMGDLMFSLVNLARRLEVEPESALREANAKFERRFRAMETALEAEGGTIEAATTEALERLWEAEKQRERKPPQS